MQKTWPDILKDVYFRGSVPVISTIEEMGEIINQSRASDREKQALKMRYAIEGSTSLTFSEIGEELHVTGNRARQLVMKGLKRIAREIEILDPNDQITQHRFSLRTHNCLKKAGLLDLEKIAKCSEEDLLSIRNFGQRSLNEVKAKLAEYELSLRGE